MGGVCGNAEEPEIMPAHMLPEHAARIEAQREAERKRHAAKEEIERKDKEKEWADSLQKVKDKQFKDITKGIASSLTDTADRYACYQTDIKCHGQRKAQELLCVEALRNKLCISGYLVDISTVHNFVDGEVWFIGVFPYDQKSPFSDERRLHYIENVQDRERRKQIALANDPRPRHKDVESINPCVAAPIPVAEAPREPIGLAGAPSAPGAPGGPTEIPEEA